MKDRWCGIRLKGDLLLFVWNAQREMVRVKKKYKNKPHRIEPQFFGKEVIISQSIICKDGVKKFEDYSWEEHLYYMGLSLTKEEKELLE